MPVKIKSIVRYKKNNPTVSLVTIGNKFNVSKQYIHKVLKKQNISTSRFPKNNVRYCLVCGKPSKRKVCLGKCHFSYYRLKINCAVCRIPFYRKRATIVLSHVRGYKKIYCTRHCYDRRSMG